MFILAIHSQPNETFYEMRLGHRGRRDKTDTFPGTQGKLIKKKRENQNK